MRDLDDALIEYQKAKRDGIDGRYEMTSQEPGFQEIEDSNLRRDRNSQSRKLEADAERAEGENELRSVIGNWAIKFVSAQIIICDIGMVAYFGHCVSLGTLVPTEVAIAWMTATLVEVIGILWVIARSLFPFRDENRDRDSEKRSNGVHL